MGSHKVIVMLVDDQAEVLAFLSSPSAYPDEPAVERIDTHTSAVFLTADRAYKLKRAVRYPYLDYSTVERRSAACEAEVLLNRRTARELYLGTLPITRHASGTLQVGGIGAVVDWVVVMRRFDQQDLLDRMAAADRLSPTVILRLADMVAEFHECAEPRLERGGAASIADVIAGNTAALASAAALDPRMVSRVDARLRRLLEQQAETIEGRRARGMVRECHGDLHLRNIVLLNGVPTLFDGIEFNEEFSCIDVMYDVAFLLMDLIARGLRAHASTLFNRYLTRTGDFEGLRVLPLFLACRAAIRAKTSLAAADLARERNAAEDLTRRAVTYLELADRVSRRAPARLIAIGGFSGTGKSTLAARLAPRLGPAPGAVVVRTDVVRKSMFAHGGSAPLPTWAYTPAARHTVYTEALREVAHALDAGYAVIMDAVFGEEADRRAIEGLAARAGVAFDGLWLEANIDVLEDRLHTRVADASDATVSVLFRQIRGGAAGVTWPRIDASSTPEWTEKEAWRYLDRPRSNAVRDGAA